jgi:iron complex outermembrane receptor protein
MVPPARPLRSGAALSLLLLAPIAAADARALAELEVEDLIALRVDVVTSASKHREPVTRAPASVTVVTAQEIRDMGHRTLAEVLGGVRGFFVTEDRNYSYLAVRGLGRPGDYNTRVLLLLDGHQVNDDLYDMAFVGNDFPLDLELVERVEIVRGPGSALYGGNAMFATVNVVTRSPSPGARSAALRGGSHGEKRARVEWASGESFLASVSGLDVTGPSLSYPEFASSPGGGTVHGLDWERGGRAFVKGVRGGVRLFAGAGIREKGIPTGAWGMAFGDERNFSRDVVGFADVAWEGALSPRLDASLRAYADEYRYAGEYAYDGGAVSYDDHRGRRAGSEARLRWRLGEHALVAGAEGRLHLRESMVTGERGEPPSLDLKRTGAAGATYAQLELSPARWLQLTAGARWDVRTDFGPVASPRLAALLDPLPGTTLKVLYGQAFRPPNLYERFYYATSPGGVDLRPETIRTTELVLERTAWRGARVSASAYRWRLDGIVDEVVTPGGELAFVNGDRVSARGLELELEQRFADGSAARASWAVQRTVGADGARLTNSPTHLGKLQLAAPVLWRLRAGLELRYASARRTLAGATAGAHLVGDASAALRELAGGRLDLRATVHNVLGTRFADPGAREHVQDLLPRDGRTFQLELVARL